MTCNKIPATAVLDNYGVGEGKHVTRSSIQVADHCTTQCVLKVAEENDPEQFDH